MSMVKSTGCWVPFLVSTTRFYSSGSRGCGTLCWHLKATGTQVVYGHSHRQSTHTHNTKYFSVKFKNRIENHGPTLSEERIRMLKLPRRMVGKLILNEWIVGFIFKRLQKTILPFLLCENTLPSTTYAPEGRPSPDTQYSILIWDFF